MLKLPDVTLVFVATRGLTISQIALDDILSKVEFGDVQIHGLDPTDIKCPAATFIRCEDFKNKADAGKYYYSQAARDVRTKFGLYMEWDAGVYDVTKWTNEFLAYDYIGAPWNTNDDYKVGNGGFTIMSTDFAQWLADPKTRRACSVDTDWAVCRTKRPVIEKLRPGTTWAPLDLAHDFSWELLQPKSRLTFGYHGNFNWPDMIGREETVRRCKVMIEDPYLRTKMTQLLTNHKWLPEAIGAESMRVYLNDNPQMVNRILPRYGSSNPGIRRSLDQRAQLLALARANALGQKGGEKA